MLIVDVLCYSYFLFLEDITSRLFSEKSYMSVHLSPGPNQDVPGVANLATESRR